MSNGKRGEVDIEIGGKTLTMVFKYDTLMVIEAAFSGRSIDELFLSGTISRTALAEGMRSGLDKKYQKKSRTQVARMIEAEIASDSEAYDRISLAVITGILLAQGKTPEQIEGYKRMVLEDDNLSMEPREKDDKEASPEDPTTRPVVLTSTGS